MKRPSQPKSFVPRIETYSGSVEGYGGPGYDWTKGVYDNRLLFDVHARGDSAAVLVERKKWEKRWASRELFLAAIEGKPLASPVCANCNRPSGSFGASYCINKTWCKRRECQEAMEVARQDYGHKVERLRQEDAAKRQSIRIDRIREIDEATKCFHWRDGWFFRRLDDGSVRVMHREEPASEWLSVDIVIPSNEWASIVCSVSAAGEDAARWDRARDFHAASPPESPDGSRGTQ